MRPYSRDLRKRVLAAYEAEEGTLREIAARFNVSTSFVKTLLRHHRETGSIDPRPHGGGRPRAIPAEHEHALRELLEDDNDLILVEIVEQLRERYGIVASKSSVDRALTRLDLTRKKRRSTRSNETGSASTKNGTSTER